MIRSLLRNPWYRKWKQPPLEISARAGLWPTGIPKSNILLTTVNWLRDFPTQKHDVKRKSSQGRTFPYLKTCEFLQASNFNDVHWWKQSEANSGLETFQETIQSPTVSRFPQQYFDTWAEHRCSVHTVTQTTQGWAWLEAPTRLKEKHAISWLVTDAASLCITSTHFFTSSAWDNALLY